MHSPSLKHRHLLIAPIALASLVIFSNLNRADLLASTAIQNVNNDEQGTYEIYKGVQIKPAEDTQLNENDEIVILKKGSVLVRSEGLVVMEAGGMQIMSIAGVIHISYNGGNLTVAALSAPVLVQKGENLVLVPVNQKWRGDGVINSQKEGLPAWLKSRSPRKIPNTFRAQQLMAAAQFPINYPSYESPLNKAGIALREALSFAQFSMARTRNTEHSADESYRRMQMLVDSGEWDSAEELLDHPWHESHFRLPEGQKLLAESVARVSDQPKLAHKFLQILITDDRVWLLSYIHPDLRNIAWGINRPKLSHEALALHIYTLPVSDILPARLPEYILRKWMEDVESIAKSANDPSVILNSISEIIVDQINIYVKDGYPERAKNYRKILYGWRDDYSDHLSAEVLDSINELEKMENVEIDELLLEESEEIEDVEALAQEYMPAIEDPVSMLTPDEVQGRAYSLLRDAGALFTVETNIEAKNEFNAEVRNIVFGTPRGDLPFEFTLNVVSGEVFNVINDGEVMPYRLSLEAYVKWLKE
ncbi:hypothetical protein KJ652_05415 [Patescibacteria group bacterium]|nr:hypothetical protein [Patescibacteria group bacterium]MBU1124001.1 hypothetical protein [Patescibacteria group bacterium]MBU1911362.1 hypothetical protein [Patescibacteria group bacterium]